MLSILHNIHNFRKTVSLISTTTFFLKEENVIQIGVKELAWIYYSKSLLNRIQPTLFGGHPTAACYHRHHQ